MEDDCLNIAFLINKLVKKLCPDDLTSMSRAVDILRKLNFNSYPKTYSTNTFKFRWIMQLEKKSKKNNVPILQKDIAILSNGLSHPNSIFYILDETRTTSSQSELSYVMPVPNLMPIKQTDLPIDYISVLQGIDGISFKWSIAQKRFIYRTSISPLLNKVTLRVGLIGCVIKTLNNFLELDKKCGIAHQNVSTIVRDMLYNHLIFVSSIQQKFSTLTPQQLLSLLLSKDIEKLIAASIICTNIMHKKGCDLYNRLYSFSSHGDNNIKEVASQMERKCFELYDSFIRSWVSQGRVSDPFSEFFIQCDDSIRLCSEWWRSRFSLISDDMIPLVLHKDMIQRIFNSGKVLNFLRQWAEPVNLNINNDIPLEEYVEIASKETTDLMMNLMFKDNNLVQAINDIHNYVLIQRGDFVFSLFDVDHVSIARKLTNIIEAFSHHLIREIDFKIKNDDWQLSYQALPPLSAIFGKNELNVYKIISTILFKLKKTEYLLIHADRSTRQLSLVYYEMLHFVQLVLNFLNIHVIQNSLKKLLKMLENPKDFDEILKAHTKHTVDIARGCWIVSSSSQCRKALERILENIELAVNSPASLAEHHKFFREIVQKFHDTLHEQKGSGKELARPLLLMFRFLEPKH